MTWQTQPNAPQPGAFLCMLDEIEDGGVRLLAFGEGSDAFRILLLRSGPRAFAYLNRCAHFGVPLAQHLHHLQFEAHKHIQCNVHYARYHWESGLCIAGECEGESLEPLPLEVNDGKITIARDTAGQVPE